jgi:hypothetical protein
LGAANQEIRTRGAKKAMRYFSYRAVTSYSFKSKAINQENEYKQSVVIERVLQETKEAAIVFEDAISTPLGVTSIADFSTSLKSQL